MATAKFSRLADVCNAWTFTESCAEAADAHKPINAPVRELFVINAIASLVIGIALNELIGPGRRLRKSRRRS